MCLCASYSLYRLFLRGYPLLGCSLLPLVGLACWRLASESMCGASVRWRQGQWSIEHHGVVTAVTVSPGSACLPWLIYLAWTELPAGRNRCLWLFPDSAPAAALRGLRVRLALER